MEIYLNEKREKPVWKKFLFEAIIWIICLSASIYLAYFISNYSLETTNMPDDSMAKTLYENDSILINKFSYHFGEPKRFDIVVFEKKDSTTDNYNIKRIVGLPGETITIKDGKLFINDVEKTEKIDVEAMHNSGLAGEGITLDKDEYFVLGDNRNGCEDSRFSSVGLVKKDEIIGKAWIRLNEISIISELNQIDEEGN